MQKNNAVSLEMLIKAKFVRKTQIIRQTKQLVKRRQLKGEKQWCLFRVTMSKK